MLTWAFSTWSAVGFPVPSPVSSHHGSSVVLPQCSCVIYSLASKSFSCMDLYSDSVFYCFWLHFLSGLWTWLVILPCLGPSKRPVTTPALPKSYGTAPWLWEHCPACPVVNLSLFILTEWPCPYCPCHSPPGPPDSFFGQTSVYAAVVVIPL